MSVINLTTENFEEEVLNAKEPVLVDFWATWCGPCQTMGPVVDELAQELTDVKVGKVNVDEQMALAREYKVMSIPTFLVFKDGNKRASVIFANHYLIAQGMGFLVIPEKDVPEFKKLLVQYYEGEPLEVIGAFLKERCWKKF